MKNVAKHASMPTTTTSMKMIPVFMATASGESAWPKQTGHASASRGARRRSARVATVVLIVPLQIPRFTLERRPICGQSHTTRETHHARQHVADLVRRLILAERPRAAERGEDDRQRDEEQVKGPQRHVSGPRARRRAPPRESAYRWCP